MAGEIQVQSEAGKGLVFSFDLPFGSRIFGNSAPTQELAGPPVLVVTDHEGNRDAIREQLLYFGCHMVETTGILEALSLLRSSKKDRPFQLAIIDACAAGNALRDHIQNKQIFHEPLLTYSPGDEGATMKVPGVAAYLTPPVKHVQLLEIIRAAMGWAGRVPDFQEALPLAKKSG